MARARALSAVLLAGAFFACAYDNAYRQDFVPPRPPICALGATRCDADVLQTCETGVDQRAGWAPTDDCGARRLSCASPELGCKPCQPGAKLCGDTLADRVDVCRPDGSGYDPGEKCAGAGRACRAGICDDLCAVARVKQSNIGCEYWAVDLDNANISASLNASAQQFAVVVSNPQLDVAANVVVEQDDGEPGTPPSIRLLGKARVTPQNLETFLLGPREVDGPNADPTMPQSERTNSAHTRRAFRITSDVPIIAYQFNPLDNANVFSNDASLLKPVEAVGGASRYVVVGWPQTIAEDDSPDHNFGQHLRSFLTIVGTRESTGVTIKTTADIVPGGAVLGTKQGETMTFRLEPFEVLNLESGAFGADFTGSIIDASGPIIVFSGSEAADAPHWNAIAERSCCADHLEEQLDPARTAGRRFVVGHSPNRARAVFASGATAIGPFDEPEYARIIAVADGAVHVKTSLPAPDDDFYLAGPGG
ncbi:MAG: IgGFc-binding protein, partial [Polyangiales bacterium]